MWSKVVESGAKWSKVVQSSQKWCKVVQSGVKCCEVVGGLENLNVTDNTECTVLNLFSPGKTLLLNMMFRQSIKFIIPNK